MRTKATFSLNAVLELRKVLEDATLAELASLLRARAEAEGQLERLHGEIRRQIRAMPIGGSHLRVRDMQLRYECVAVLENAIRNQAAALAARESEVDAARAAVIAARRARKVIEVLRDRRMAALRAAEHRSEQADLDESNRFRGV
jgi:flagellar export protein FliJ